MGKIVIFALLVVAIAVASVVGAPAEEYEHLMLADHQEVQLNRPVDAGHVRIRRVTCDVLSAGGWVNDSACALNCIRLKKRGGHCSKGVCVCRK